MQIKTFHFCAFNKLVIFNCKTALELIIFISFIAILLYFLESHLRLGYVPKTPVDILTRWDKLLQ